MQPAPARQAILPLDLKDKAALYQAYMSAVRGGGLFIPTTQPFRLGDEIFVLLHLEEVQERLPVSGKVVWLTPAQAHSGGGPGIGVQFNDAPDGEAARARIEALLGAMLNADRPTHTM